MPKAAGGIIDELHIIAFSSDFISRARHIDIVFFSVNPRLGVFIPGVSKFVGNDSGQASGINTDAKSALIEYLLIQNANGASASLFYPLAVGRYHLEVLGPRAVYAMYGILLKEKHTVLIGAYAGKRPRRADIDSPAILGIIIEDEPVERSPKQEQNNSLLAAAHPHSRLL